MATLNAPIKLDVKNLPGYARAIIAVLPAIIILVAAVVIFIMPKQKEIKALDAQVDTQNNKIAESQAKVAKLDILMRENQKLAERLNELKELLPVEKDVSGLLKQISDLSIASGLDVKSWRPKPKVKHPSGIIFEIPSDIIVSGTYHDFLSFLAGLTKLPRIVNVNTIRLSGAKKGRDPANTVLDITFTLSAFSSVPEGAAGK
ncbi:MAG: type 4a pilus biogenesis protein PilO [Nitrospiraceae bacterium]|nr:type 4a pilus biogenesis protein PilO [Nitrospiraceae bacterium]